MIGQNAPTTSPKQVNFAFLFKKVGRQKKSKKSMLDWLIYSTYEHSIKPNLVGQQSPVQLFLS